MNKFRYHRGGFKESMDTTEVVATEQDLKNLLEKDYGILNLRFKPMGVDRRNGWNTHLVLGNFVGDDWFPVGYTNGKF